LAGGTEDALGGVANGIIETPGVTDLWHFQASAGQSVFLDMQRIDGITSVADAIELELLGPEGTVWRHSGQALPDLLDTEPTELSASGDYVLIVRGSGDDQARYQFRLVDVTPAAIALDTPIPGAIDLPGQTFRYTFDADAGQAIIFDLIHNQLDATGGGVSFTLVDPSGNELFAGVADDQPIGSLPATGTYTLSVDQQVWHDLDFVGSYSFQVIDGMATVDPPAAADLVVSQVTAPVRVIGNS
jgi:hypothetical protein